MSSAMFDNPCLFFEQLNVFTCILFSRIQGNYKDVNPLFERSVEILEAAHGRNHPDVATALSNWAALFKLQVKE